MVGSKSGLYFAINTITIEVTNAIIFTDYITEDMTLTNDREWIFQNSMIISNGAILNIDPGTIVRMSSQAKIIVCPTCSIFSNGTAEEPVKITGVSGPGVGESYVYWGGIIIEHNQDTEGQLGGSSSQITAYYGNEEESLSSLDEIPNSIAFQRAKFFFTEFEYARAPGLSNYTYEGSFLAQNCIFSYNTNGSSGGFISSSGTAFLDKCLVTWSYFNESI